MRYILFLPLLLFGADVTPPIISNVSVEPNPFSPDGDGIADITTIKFVLSEPCTVTITIPADPSSPYDLGLREAGENEWTWDGAGLPEGKYYFKIDAVDTAGNPADPADGTVIIDTLPPYIKNVSEEPNPFTPNGDGITDYVYIEFYIQYSYPPQDSIFFIYPVGTLYVDSTSCKVVQDTFPEYPVYLYLVPITGPSVKITLKYTHYNGNEYTLVFPAYTSTQKHIAGEYEKWYSIPYPSEVTAAGSAGDIFLIYAFTGALNVSIYYPDGSLFKSYDLWDIYFGDGWYQFMWGGVIPDGEYVYRITCEDETYNIRKKSGTVIANSYPIEITDNYVEPNRIAPQDQNEIYDECTITYTISEDGRTTVRIYNSPTQFDSTTLVRTLINGQDQAAGTHAVPFDGRNDAGNFLAQNEESTYTYVITVVDPITGDADQVTGSIVIDNKAPPAPYLNQPPTPTSSGVTEISGGGERGARIDLYRNGIKILEGYADPATGSFIFNDVPLVEGPNRFYAFAIDSVLNQGPSSDTVEVIYDATPGYLVSCYPADGSYMNDPSLAGVYAVIGDAYSGIDLASSDLTVRVGTQTVFGTLERRSPDTLYYAFSSPLSINGVYLVSVSIVDQVGNVADTSFSFIFDTEPPTASITPADSSVLSSLTAITVDISDNVAGVDAELVNMEMVGPNGTVNLDKSGGEETVTFTPNPPLATDGSDDGRYYITLYVQDRAGNADTFAYTYLYDTSPPSIVSNFPSQDTIIMDTLTRVWVVFTDAKTGIETSGVNFAGTSVKLYRSDGRIVDGTKTVNGDTVIWTLTQPLAEGGNYYIDVIALDNAGNIDSTEIPFILDNHAPWVVAYFPWGYHSGSFSTVTVHLHEGGESGISTVDIDLIKAFNLEHIPIDSVILRDTVVTAYLGITVPASGSYDGFYRIPVYVKDVAGNEMYDTLPFTYDNIPPWIEASVPDSGTVNYVFVDTTPEGYRGVWVEVSDIYPGVDSVSRIDFTRSTIELLNPDGRGVPGYKTYVDDGDGTGKIYWNIADEAQLTGGTYTMNVYLVDRAGNESYHTITFTAKSTIPEVIAWFPREDYVNYVDKVGAVVLDNSGTGIDTAATTITLEGPPGVLSGQEVWQGDTVYLVLDTVLPAEDAYNGTYKTTVNAVSNDGSKGTYSDLFVYDTRPPWVVERYPAEGDTVSSSPDSVWVKVNDNASPINTSLTTLKLYTGDGVEISGSVSYDAIDGILYFWLSSPLTVGGTYMMVAHLVDMAGNVAEDTSYFMYTPGAEVPYAVEEFPADNDTVTEVLRRVWVRVANTDMDTSGIEYVIRNETDTIPGTPSAKGDTLIYTFSQPLPNDGSGDGEYTWRVNLISLDGSPYSVEYTFFYQVDEVCTLVLDSVWGAEYELSGDTFVTIDTMLIFSFTTDSGAHYTAILGGEMIPGEADTAGKFDIQVPLEVGEPINLMVWAQDDAGNFSDTLEYLMLRKRPEFEVKVPKPARGDSAVFTIVSPKSGRAELKLYNLAGEFVWKTTINLSPGRENYARWFLENIDGVDVTNGVYILLVDVRYDDGTREERARYLVPVIK